MQIDRIGTDKSYEMVGPYGLKIWDKKSISGTISPGEDIQQAYKELDNILEAAHAETLTQMDLYRGTSVRDVSEPKEAPIKPLIDEMEACTTYADIQSYRFTVKNDAEKAVYERKLTELSPIK